MCSEMSINVCSIMLNKVFCAIVVFLLHPLGKLGYCAIKNEGLLD